MGKCFTLLKKIEFLCQNLNDVLKKTSQNQFKKFARFLYMVQGSQKFIKLLRNFLFIIFLKAKWMIVALAIS